MNAKEALESIKGIDIVVEHRAYHYTDTDYKEAFECVESALLRLESAEKELAEIKGRAEATKKEYDRGVLWQNEVCEDIDFIIKGEGK